MQKKITCIILSSRAPFFFLSSLHSLPLLLDLRHANLVVKRLRLGLKGRNKLTQNTRVAFSGALNLVFGGFGLDADRVMARHEVADCVVHLKEKRRERE